jgi:alkanesulfonate monooxygenase SsuD/methylene tetrahydromethanopterin reductase-like flavin-dependent oxidoreductase (luciferase family)
MDDRRCRDAVTDRTLPGLDRGSTRAALLRAATFGDACLPYLVTADQVAFGRERLSALARQQGRPIPAISAYCFVRVERDGRAARNRAAEFVAARYSIPLNRADRYVVAGDASQCVERLG